MAYQAIKYRLTEEGSVPDFIFQDPSGMSGLYPVYDNVYPYPRNVVLVGISVDNPVGDFEVFTTKSDLENYLSDVGKDWVGLSMEYQPMPFDPVYAANSVWTALDSLNGVGAESPPKVTS